MANIEVGGVKAEIKSEIPDNVVEISHEDVFANDDHDKDDPFKNDDSDDNGDDPFNSDDSDNELVHSKEKRFVVHKKQQLDQLKIVKISPKAENVFGLHNNNDTDIDTKEFKTKDNLNSQEKLVLNFTKNDDLLDKNKKKISKEGVRNIDWSGAYRTVEGTSVEEDERKVVVTNIPLSYVAASEYTVEDYDRFCCNSCKFVTKYKRWIVKHIRLQHRDVTKMYQCPYCPYKSKYSPRYHIICCHKSESELEWFRCGECGFKAKLKSSLRSHILTHMQPHQIMDRLKKCDQCPRMFKSNEVLSRHIKYVHEKHKIEKLKCTECDYECFRPGSLKNHKNLWHSNFETLEYLKCPNCPYKTKVKHRFNAHVKQKHKQTIQCDKCTYTTDMMDKMKLHLITHKKVIDEADMKYRCDKCPYKTYRQYSFSVHKLNHLKPEEIHYFYCYHCQFKAKRKDNLKTHVLRHFKQNEVPLQCFICDFTTKRRELLTRHIDRHSKKSENQQIESVVSKKKQTKPKNLKTKVASRTK